MKNGRAACLYVKRLGTFWTQPITLGTRREGGSEIGEGREMRKPLARRWGERLRAQTTETSALRRITICCIGAISRRHQASPSTTSSSQVFFCSTETVTWLEFGFYHSNKMLLLPKAKTWPPSHPCARKITLCCIWLLFEMISRLKEVGSERIELSFFHSSRCQALPTFKHCPSSQYSYNVLFLYFFRAGLSSFESKRTRFKF